MTYQPKQFKIGNLIGVIGYASKDADFSTTPNGAKVCKFSLVIGKDDTKEQGKQSTFANCECWRELAEYAENIKKGDTVFAIGIIKTREYNGNTYTTLTADWLNIAKIAQGTVQTQPLPTQEAQKENFSIGEFEEIDTNESDLPF